MFCNNCGKEIPEESVFCPCCGTNLKNETEQVIEEKEMKENNQEQVVNETLEQEEITSNNIENEEIADIKTKRNYKKIIIFTVLIIAIMLMGFFIYCSINNKNILSIEQDGQNSIEQESNKEEKEIPEEKKVYVNFKRDGQEDSVEVREIDREKLLNYFNHLYNSVLDAGLSLNMPIYDYTMQLYYIEYDYQIGDMQTTSTSNYGAIMYAHLIKMGSNYINDVSYKTFIANWTSTNEIWKKYSAIYESPMIKGIPQKNTISNMANNRIFSDIENSIKISGNIKYSNVRIGLITIKENKWLEEFFNKAGNLKDENNENEGSSSTTENDITANEETNEEKENSNNNQSNEDIKEEETKKDFTVKWEDIETETNDDELKSIICFYVSECDYYSCTATLNGKSIYSDKLYTGGCYESICTKELLKEGRNELKISVTNESGVTKEDTKIIKLTYIAPTITILNKETTTDKDVIEFFDIKIVNGDGIYESTFDVTIKRNGETLKKYNDIISGNYTNFSCAVELVDGENQIEVIATNVKGKSSSKKYTITKIEE